MPEQNQQSGSDRAARFSPILAHESNAMGFALSAAQIDSLLAYLELFIKWNKTYNLSAIRDPDEMLYKHLLDSLSIASHLSQSSFKHFIDVGTGGGLPGIPMAICFPERQFTLLDSAGKKMRFLFQVKQSLGLTNVDIQNCRVESFKPPHSFDVVMSRAFASLQDMTHHCAHLLDSHGEFWAMKGLIPKGELSEVEKHYKVEDCFSLSVPGDVGERCLVVLKPQ
ncbi:Ribosomal RNA small subunit methyltransferase G [Thalassocella blandensis]|nr:Ribosomal RNA small subunit methyltransferase G [Thalassocella blandensis]